jgi:CubicO group peptidase (beta-lactamase class C family)
MTLKHIAIVCCLISASANAAIVDHVPGTTWEHSDPQQQGWSPDLLEQAHAWSDRIRSSAVMIIQHGMVVAEWGNTEKRMELASVRKSLLSALIGVAVERHQINLSATIGSLGIDDNPPSLSEQEKQATVLDLLRARSGIYHAALYETPGMAALRPPRFSHAPGTFWYYNNWDFNALGTIYQHATQVSIFQALDEQIAKPIGMQDYRPSDGIYFTGAASVHPAYPIRMSARDLARFALLYLHDGRWRDQQLVPAQWVHDSTRPYSRSTFGPGYGYLWWTGFLDDGFAPTVKLPAGTFFALGAGGQYAIVLPAYDLVVVHRVDRDIADYREPGMREIGRLLWLILSADHQQDIGPDASIEAAHGTRLDDAALRSTLSGATLAFGETATGGPYEARLAVDGGYTVLNSSPPTVSASGTWMIDKNRLCRTLKDTRCYTVVADGNDLVLFDRNGILQFVTHPRP